MVSLRRFLMVKTEWNLKGQSQLATGEKNQLDGDFEMCETFCDQANNTEIWSPVLPLSWTCAKMKTRHVSSAPVPEVGRDFSSGSSSPASASFGVDEISRMSEAKSKGIAKGSDEASWKETIRLQMEDELNQRVREALETPPLERAEKQRTPHPGAGPRSDGFGSRIIFNFDSRDYLNNQNWRAIQAQRQMQRLVRMNYMQQNPNIDFMFRDELSKSNQDEFPGVFGLENLSEGIKDLSRQSLEKYPTLRQIQRQFYTKEGYLAALRAGKFPDGTKISTEGDGTYVDKFGVVRDGNGPFWPSDVGPLFPTPRFLWFTEHLPVEPLFFHIHNLQFPVTFDNQSSQYTGKWRGVLIVYDSERSSRDRIPQPVPDGCCPNLMFESRFESGNLRQARRVGQFEYELVLKTDLHTNRHTQWYYFRVQNTVPGIVYKFRIVNLLKRDSLYNYGMRPLCYSEKSAKTKQIGWIRAGHHISYSRNIMHLHCPLLMRGVPYYELEWQTSFPNEEDTYYLAHCYPYTFTDLKEDLDSLLNSPERRQWIRREVLCETRAGNSCFLVTVTNFENSKEEQDMKQVIVVTARVHPGESQASWMMKGLLDFITGPDPGAKQLRNVFIFKVVPMLNPDGVIVGNYRCSLAARDLNRNYRHPRKESFPTVWHVKSMMDKVLERHNILLYCDLHGHSRKHNVFMYGNNTSQDGDNNTTGAAKSFLQERLFPWIMSQKAPEKFSFQSCKFQIKRCKEATGRVVMWRQMHILNSFTLEATFSGTILNKSEPRHFNVADFLEMGRVLCQTVLEYHLTQENKAKQTDMVLELTRFVTHQVLEQKGLVNSPVRLPQLKGLHLNTNDKLVTHGENGYISDSGLVGVEPSHDMCHPQFDLGSDSLREAIVSYLEQEKPVSGDEVKKDKKQKVNGGSKNHQEVSKSHSSGNLSRKEVDNMIESASLKTMDGCLKILAQLNVREAIPDSDSSDSDSESEAEMKVVDTKSKKKKRKSRKQRDREQNDRKGGGSGGSDKKEERSKSLSALPTITCSDALHDNLGHSVNQKKQSSANLEKYMRAQKKDAPHFVSKYEGRRNGGIPCFSEERSLERAAKRMAEMKKRTEDEKRREMAFFCELEDGLCSCPQSLMPVHQQLNRSLTNDELQRRLQVALSEGTPNIAQTLVGLNIRTSYTHAADTFREMAPAVLPSTIPQPREIRSGPLYKSFTRQTTTPAATASTGFMATPLPGMSEDATKLVGRQRISRTPGPLIRGIKKVLASPQLTAIFEFLKVKDQHLGEHICVPPLIARKNSLDKNNGNNRWTDKASSMLYSRPRRLEGQALDTPIPVQYLSKWTNAEMFRRSQTYTSLSEPVPNQRYTLYITV
ncbi:Cytosolic carboxypeptidase 2 [Mizuhopecten yessoensis]|uniref:Cytosolic carboxypeptidase 2 n=1 Tax=Mizuhopecten yessoensis TaxID=6573 RepID=A0A210PQT8_MIZYE|nr:Cytosolic carboxypeptidase 2 [Mizuhopecten yessoensis]